MQASDPCYVITLKTYDNNDQEHFHWRLTFTALKWLQKHYCTRCSLSQGISYSRGSWGLCFLIKFKEWYFNDSKTMIGDMDLFFKVIEDHIINLIKLPCKLNIGGYDFVTLFRDLVTYLWPWKEEPVLSMKFELVHCKNTLLCWSFIFAVKLEGDECLPTNDALLRSPVSFSAIWQINSKTWSTCLKMGHGHLMIMTNVWQAACGGSSFVRVYFMVDKLSSLN